MSDEELVRLCAEKVMGWTLVAHELASPEWYEGDQFVAHAWDYRCSQCESISFSWNPLTSDAAACMVLDKMTEEGWECRTYAMPFYSPQQPIAPGHKCEFAKLNMDEPAPVFRGYGPAGAGGRRRAIVTAALKAVGVSIPTSA